MLYLPMYSTGDGVGNDCNLVLLRPTIVVMIGGILVMGEETIGERLTQPEYSKE